MSFLITYIRLARLADMLTVRQYAWIALGHHWPPGGNQAPMSRCSLHTTASPHSTRDVIKTWRPLRILMSRTPSQDRAATHAGATCLGKVGITRSRDAIISYRNVLTDKISLAIRTYERIITRECYTSRLVIYRTAVSNGSAKNIWWSIAHSQTCFYFHVLFWCLNGCLYLFAVTV